MENIKLKWIQCFLKKQFKQAVVAFEEKFRALLENEWDKNCVFFDTGLVTLRSYYTTFFSESRFGVKCLVFDRPIVKSIRSFTHWQGYI